MGDLPRGGSQARKGAQVGQDRLLLNIQATGATLDWESQPGHVLLLVQTVLPDDYVLPVVEELQAQQEQAPELPQVFIRLEVARPDQKEGLPK